MSSIVILGAGNVAFHLTRALIENTCNVRQIFNRTLEHAREIGEANRISYTDKISEIEKADIYIIASADSGIEEFSHYIPYDDVLVVHTSGSSPMSVLKGDYRKGVFYPLQTFSKERTMRYDNIPFFIEAENSEDLKKLNELGNRISNEVHELNFASRMQVHMTGVWANNFVNHLYYIAGNICEQNNVPFDVLLPLIQETANKVIEMSPKDAQTGPAKRGDQVIIDRHLEALQDDSRLLQIYQILTDSIKRVYEK
ncbi:Rossmann-like and DUF2520 domain-containing protein [Empedobacter falsenii]|uniref:DUF2520 domain-containing protein n=2 Tax=Pseudomonadati TaxID=3379134 RepID=A0A7H9DWI9_9FLAO|nr:MULTISPECIES: Rossmann-like and DUF2520 domain-containing protein [Empedobacter]HBX62632.1 DUF2520 domain-containing protein [Flavobacteriaceae bacterium]MDH0658948.1 DUF2520 domain-containing protein [Empedobacter sp. GD03865]MDH0673213.1 DUF2520 domain-containing protein [Empedobacter sp. GD03861]MDH1881848.1 DUF2520 domain-containing protein [Empedobacter sp. GD03797]MDH2207152.1 DUF2520 domain-containing protein [Empedobacter sp. GD03644]